MINPLRTPPLVRELHVTSPYGQRVHPVTGELGKMHFGTDLRGNEKDEVVAPFDGVVSFAGFGEIGGNQIYIRNGNGWEVRNFHLSRRDVKNGERVRCGQVIGMAGQTGRVNGPHLHFELLDPGGKHLDPWPFLNDLVKRKATCGSGGGLKKLALAGVALGVLSKLGGG